jgi:hypothetical protein
VHGDFESGGDCYRLGHVFSVLRVKFYVFIDSMASQLGVPIYGVPTLMVFGVPTWRPRLRVPFWASRLASRMGYLLRCVECGVPSWGCGLASQLGVPFWGVFGGGYISMRSVVYIFLF